MTKAIIDGAAMYMASRTLGFNIKYSRLMDWLQREFQVTDAVICTAMDSSGKFDTAREVLGQAEKIGFRLFVRNTVGKNLSGAALLAAEMAESYIRDQDVVLWYGGGDMRPIVDRALDRGVRVTIVSHREALSHALAGAVGGHVDIKDHIQHIGRIKP